MNVIETMGFTKFYGKSRGVVDLNLSVSQGEFFGFIGPNGAGKSTTIRALLGLIKPSSGSAKIFGKDILSEKETRYLPSEAVFYSGMRVKEIIKLSAGLRKADCAKEAERLCERLKLDVSKKVEELSFGNRKKVAIVCALQSKPRLCILDEPTSGLDPSTAAAIHKMLLDLRAEGMAIFLTTHNMEEAAKLCDKVALLCQGEIVEFGSPQEICLKYNKDKKYRALLSGQEEALLGQSEEDIRKLSEWLLSDRVLSLHSCEPTLESVF